MIADEEIYKKRNIFGAQPDGIFPHSADSGILLAVYSAPGIFCSRACGADFQFDRSV